MGHLDPPAKERNLAPVDAAHSPGGENTNPRASGQVLIRGAATRAVVHPCLIPERSLVRAPTPGQPVERPVQRVRHGVDDDRNDQG